MTQRHGVFKNFLLIFVLCFILYLWVSKNCPEAEKVAMYVADNIYVAYLSCFAVIFLKCFVTLLPTTLAFMVFGYLLPPVHAFLTCMLSTAVLFSASYHKGKALNNGSPQENRAGGDKLGVFLTSMSIHCLRFFQCSITGSFFGKIGAPYFASLSGALLGMLPSIALSLSLTDFLLLFN